MKTKLKTKKQKWKTRNTICLIGYFISHFIALFISSCPIILLAFLDVFTKISNIHTASEVLILFLPFIWLGACFITWLCAQIFVIFSFYIKDPWGTLLAIVSYIALLIFNFILFVIPIILHFTEISSLFFTIIFFTVLFRLAIISLPIYFLLLIIYLLILISLVVSSITSLIFLLLRKRYRKKDVEYDKRLLEEFNEKIESQSIMGDYITLDTNSEM